MTKIGVYGTLKKNFPNHDRIFGNGKYSVISHGANFPAMMVHLRGCPGIILREAIPDNHPAKAFCNQYSICAEVYSIDDEILKAMDKLEQHPVWYKRVPIKHPHLGEVQLYTLPAGRYMRGMQSIIPSGYWAGPTSGGLVVDFGEGTEKPKVKYWEGKKPWVRVGDKWVPVDEGKILTRNPGLKIPTKSVSLPPEEPNHHMYDPLWADDDEDYAICNITGPVPKEEKELHPEILIDTDDLYELKQA